MSQKKKVVSVVRVDPSRRRVVGLLRVSTDQQDVQRQRTDVGRVILSHNLDAIRTVAAVDVSGRTVMSDPQFQQIFRDLERPDVAGIAISALDRLFRPDNFGDFAILDIFRRNKKLIFSAKEGVLDPSSDAGFMMSLMSGAQAGMEWRELRRRTLQGKAEKRGEGFHVDGGDQTLPRGVAFTPIIGPNKKKTGGTWSYTEPDASRVGKPSICCLSGAPGMTSLNESAADGATRASSAVCRIPSGRASGASPMAWVEASRGASSTRL